MMNLPVPSWRTTRAMALLRRPVPMMVCAANPPGSLDLTNFLRSSVSGSASAVAETTREGVLGKRERERLVAKERVLGL